MKEIIKKENIEDMIYEIRGKQVMLDSDLAKLYQCKNGTKEVNQAVRRNLDKFPDDFHFQLTKEELLSLKSQFVTSSWNNYGGIRKLPHVFTEEGVAMLATILKTEVASKMSVAIMKAFVAMRHYIGTNEYRLSNIENKIVEHDNNIKQLEQSFQKLEEKRVVNEIYFNGQIYDAYSKILDIFKEAKREIIIIDSYADKTVLDIIKRLKIGVIIITKANNLLTKQDISKYNKQYHNLEVVYDNTFHDRYFILDKKKVYHCGASINRIGYKTFSITEISDKDLGSLLISKIKV
ncbi:MAG: ORF6N domain-containing protein [Bacilli bacterium]|nr:ORF6N domain-containing protein [Bacilli bacterium]